MINFFRWLGTAVLLYFTWRDAPWSVALPLTLLAIHSEMQAALWKQLVKGRRL